jgi:hypothetical protein
VTVKVFGSESLVDPGSIDLWYAPGNLVVWKDNSGITIPGLRGQVGILYHWNVFAYGVSGTGEQIKEDIMFDGYGHHVVLMLISTDAVITLGPM